MDAQEFELYMRMLEFKQANLLLLSDIANKWSSVVWPMRTFIGVFIGFLGSLITFSFLKYGNTKDIFAFVSFVLALASLIFFAIWVETSSVTSTGVLVSFARK